MKLSLDWLHDFVDLSDLSGAEVAELLSLHTAEVEGVEETAAELADVRVGEVVACKRHPDAERLSVTRVRFAEGEEPVPVVCGAPNVRTGLKVAFAPVGARLPGGLKIKKAKLRGQASHGMICSASELGLGDDHSGILELAADAPVGAPLREHLGLRDEVLEIDNKSLTHRPDLWGHHGFARELAAILDRPLAALDHRLDWPSGEVSFGLEVEDREACPYYHGTLLDVAEGPKPSPEFVRRRLLAVGQQPKDDLVDLTNYVLLETGQPLHAFDRDRLAGGRILVRPARRGERFVALDGAVLELVEEDLVIADAERPVALAGVIGGAESAVGEGTTRLFLEAAAFDPVRVRRTAQRHAMRTEASSRFEKSLDPCGVAPAAERFLHLLLAARGDEVRVLGPPLQSGRPHPPERVIAFRPRRAAEVLGLDLEPQWQAQGLRRLGFTVDDESDPWRVRVPSWRATKDVTREVDLVEEVGRLRGYDRIVAAPWPWPSLPPAELPHHRLEAELAARLRNAHGGYETQCYPFLEEAWAERLGLPLDAFLRVANPVQAGVGLIRRDPVPSLVEQAANDLREAATGLLFEAARGYEPVAGSEPRERKWLGGVLWSRGEAPLEGPGSAFERVRGVVEDLAFQAGLSALPAPASGAGPATPWLHPRHALTWMHDGRFLACSGRLAPDLAAAYADEAVLAVFLLDLEALVAVRAAAPALRFQPPSRFPAVKVDVALALPASVPYEEVAGALRRAGGKLLESLELFDLYQGPNLPEGWRSLAFHAVLRAHDRTLGEAEEQRFLARAEKAAAALGGRLRS